MDFPSYLFIAELRLCGIQEWVICKVVSTTLYQCSISQKSFCTILFSTYSVFTSFLLFSIIAHLVTSIISSIFSVLLVGFAITSEVFLTPRGFWLGDWRSYDYRSLGIVLSAIQLLIGLLEFAIAIAATTCSCRVLSFLNDNPGSVYPGAVYPGAVYPGAVYPGAVHPGAFDYQNPGAVMGSPGSVVYQYPGSVMHSQKMSTPQMVAPQLAAPQMTAPQMTTPQMTAPQMAAPQLATPQMDEPQIQIQEV